MLCLVKYGCIVLSLNKVTLSLSVRMCMYVYTYVYIYMSLLLAFSGVVNELKSNRSALLSGSIAGSAIARRDLGLATKRGTAN